jgi:hypothetical protein
VFTARYGLNLYITQIRLVLKGLNYIFEVHRTRSHFVNFSLVDDVKMTEIAQSV